MRNVSFWLSGFARCLKARVWLMISSAIVNEQPRISLLSCFGRWRSGFRPAKWCGIARLEAHSCHLKGPSPFYSAWRAAHMSIKPECADARVWSKAVSLRVLFRSF